MEKSAGICFNKRVVAAMRELKLVVNKIWQL